MNVFIAGGTSGLGLGLALHYLKQGHRVGVCGRDISKVDPAIRKDHEQLELYELDVFDKTDLSKSVRQFSQGKLDLMIACAGSYANSRTKRLTKEEATTMLKVNVVGTCNALDIARELMQQQQTGQIVAIASVAGLIHYPGASVYSATKGVVLKLCSAYNRALSPFGIHVSAIAPGYIDTPKLRELNHGDISKKPFVVSLDYAVQKIVESIEQKRELTIFPLRMKLTIQLFSLLPKRLVSLFLLKGKKDSHEN